MDIDMIAELLNSAGVPPVYTTAGKMLYNYYPKVQSYAGERRRNSEQLVENINRQRQRMAENVEQAHEATVGNVPMNDTTAIGTRTNPVGPNINIRENRPRRNRTNTYEFQLRSTGLRCYVNGLQTIHPKYYLQDVGENTYLTPLLVSGGNVTTDTSFWLDDGITGNTEHNKQFLSRNSQFQQMCQITIDPFTIPPGILKDPNDANISYDEDIILRLNIDVPQRSGQYYNVKRSNNKEWFDDVHIQANNLEINGSILSTGSTFGFMNDNPTVYDTARNLFNVMPEVPGAGSGNRNSLHRHSVNHVFGTTQATPYKLNEFRHYADIQINKTQLTHIPDIFRFKEARFAGLEISYRPFSKIRGNPFMGFFAILNQFKNAGDAQSQTIDIYDNDKVKEYITDSLKPYMTYNNEKHTASLNDVSYLLSHMQHLITQKPMNEPWKLFFPMHNDFMPDKNDILHKDKTWVSPINLIKLVNDYSWNQNNEVSTFDKFIKIIAIPFTKDEIYRELKWDTAPMSQYFNIIKIVNDEEWEDQHLPKQDQGRSAYMFKPILQTYDVNLYYSQGVEIHKGTLMFDSVMRALSKSEPVRQQNFTYDIKRPYYNDSEDTLIRNVVETKHDFRFSDEFTKNLKNKFKNFLSYRHFDQTSEEGIMHTSCHAPNYQNLVQQPFGDIFFTWKLEARRPLLSDPISNYNIGKDILEATNDPLL